MSQNQFNIDGSGVKNKHNEWLKKTTIALLESYFNQCSLEAIQIHFSSSVVTRCRHVRRAFDEIRISCFFNVASMWHFRIGFSYKRRVHARVRHKKVQEACWYHLSLVCGERL